MMPLVAQRLADNIAALCHSIADVLARFGNVMRKLNGDARDKPACMAGISTTL
jgi:hypothetical protein